MRKNVNRQYIIMNYSLPLHHDSQISPFLSARGDYLGALSNSHPGNAAQPRPFHRQVDAFGHVWYTLSGHLVGGVPTAATQSILPDLAVPRTHGRTHRIGTALLYRRFAQWRMARLLGQCRRGNLGTAYRLVAPLEMAANRHQEKSHVRDAFSLFLFGFFIRNVYLCTRKSNWNVFVKSNDQSQTCLSFGMARKVSMKCNNKIE